MKPPVNLDVNIEVGKETSQQIVDAIDDIFSPAREILGAVGDHIRVYRANSVLRTFSQTKKLAEKAGLKLKAPPIKFLVPFIEEASLEDEGAESLTELWAKLLVSASTEYTEFHQSYIYTLKHLGPISAAVLAQMSKPGLGLPQESKIKRASVVHDALSTESGTRAIAERFSNFHRDSDVLNFCNSFDVTGTMLKHVEIYFPSHIYCEGLRWRNLKENHSISSLNKAVEVLCRENVVQAPTSTWKDIDGIMVVGVIRYLILTDLGEGFLNACMSTTEAQS